MERGAASRRRRCRAFSTVFIALVEILSRIHRSSLAQYSRLYCRLGCCSVFVRRWEKDTVYPLFAFLPVSMHLRPDTPCSAGRGGGAGARQRASPR